MPSRSCRICLNDGLVALPLVLGAHQQDRGAARIEADLGIFRLRGPAACSIALTMPRPRSLPRFARCLAPRREAGIVASFSAMSMFFSNSPQS